jgi:hypothetical protein
MECGGLYATTWADFSDPGERVRHVRGLAEAGSDDRKEGEP